MKLAEYKAMKSKKRTKFGAVACKRDGIRFHSKLERAYYDHLVNLKKEGIVSYFLRQVPFGLPGNIKYVCDFMVVYVNEIEYVDVKGKCTQVYLNKKKTLEALYPVTIIEVRKGEF